MISFEFEYRLMHPITLHLLTIFMNVLLITVLKLFTERSSTRFLVRWMFFTVLLPFRWMVIYHYSLGNYSFHGRKTSWNHNQPFRTGDTREKTHSVSNRYIHTELSNKTKSNIFRFETFYIPRVRTERIGPDTVW